MNRIFLHQINTRIGNWLQGAGSCLQLFGRVRTSRTLDDDQRLIIDANRALAPIEQILMTLEDEHSRRPSSPTPI